MARYYRRRYTRVVKPKKKWASNIRTLNAASPSTWAGSQNLFTSVELVSNSSEASTPTPVIIKTGNFKLQVDVAYATASSTSVECKCFVVYLPEGMTISTVNGVNDLIERHPEWVIAWKYASLDPITSANTPIGSQTMQFSSRLKRNLNSGDKVMFYCIMKTASTSVSITAYGVGGMAQFWTCAN